MAKKITINQNVQVKTYEEFHETLVFLAKKQSTKNGIGNINFGGNSILDEKGKSVITFNINWTEEKDI